MLGRFDSVNDDELIGFVGKFGSDAIAELKARGFFKKGYPGVDRMDLVNVFKAHIDECFAAMVEIVDEAPVFDMENPVGEVIDAGRDGRVFSELQAELPPVGVKAYALVSGSEQ